MWFIFALSSAILASFRKVNDKHLSHAVNHLHLAWMTKAVTLPIIGGLALLSGQLLPDGELSMAFWISTLLCILVTTPLDTAVYLQSLKHGQLSKTAPLITLWPVLMLVMGALFLGQIPSFGAVLSVIIIVAGVYVLNTSRGNTNVLRNIWSNRGTRFGLLGVATLSANTTLGAIGVLQSSPLFFAFWAGMGTVFVQGVFAQVVAPGKFRHPHKWLLLQNGVVQGLATSTYSYAVATGPVGYVTAIRSLSAPLSAVVGARTFSEGMGRRKILALSVITVGAVLLGIEA